MARPSVHYFAYGSNTDPRRFRERVGPWRSRRRARAEGWRLRFADSVRSEGGGGAVIDPHPDASVAGVVFEISDEQLAAMDREEFAADRDTSGTGKRVRIAVETEEGRLEAEVYTVDDDRGHRAPSARYLQFILDGLAAAGHPDSALEGVRRAAREARTRSEAD